jgi:hypothetical protein
LAFVPVYLYLRFKGWKRQNQWGCQ